MTASATVGIKINVYELANQPEVYSFVDMTVPVEVLTGYTVVETATATALQLFDDVTKIALAKVYGVYIKAELGTIYILINTAGTATFTSTTATLVLNEGEACYLPINPAVNAGLKIDAAANTNAFSYLILGK
jgi:hypothetical protein